MAVDRNIWLPFPPSVNNLFAHGVVKGRVRRFPTAKYKRWRKEAEILVMAARIKRYDEPVVVKLRLIPPDTRARDADNYAKPVLDVLVAARALHDDSNRYVKAVLPYWENASCKPGVEVTIRLARDTGKPALNGEERRLLAAIRYDGTFVVPASHRPSQVLVGLIEKGYVNALPGLLDGTPQAYQAAD